MDIKNCIDEMLHTEARAPLATYRLQMHNDFPFSAAEAILPYLRRLGISDAYASPIFEARPGSMHGYDVSRHDRINPELGGEKGFERFVSAVHSAGMELLLDIVPNHMGVGNESIWWQDVLENGRASEFAEYFDIDWKPLKPDMAGKLLLPILGAQYGEELEKKRIQIANEAGRMRVRYFDHSMPLAPRTLPLLFPEEEHEAREIPQSFRDLLRELTHIPPHETSDPALAVQRREQLRELKPRLEEALRSPELKPLLDATIERVNGREGDPGSFDRLHELLEAQPYRLAYWRVSSEEINYRRFFDVNDLVGLRMENPDVFAATHCLIRHMLTRKQVWGLRVDHCDGMFNPREYLINLQLLYIASQCGGETPVGPIARSGFEQEISDAVRNFDWASVQGPLYVVVEKILEPRESLPKEWPVRGTSGYDFVHFANQIFIQPKNERRFTAFYDSFTGKHSDPDEIIYRAKLDVMQSSLSSEAYVLTNLLSHLAASNRRARDFTDNLLEAAIRETIACFPVYRTYIDDRGQYTERDRGVIHQAISRAKLRNPGIDGSVFDFLERTLLLSGRTEDVDPRELYFALKFQQLTGPVMAKGVEDTAFYVYTRFISSNEVGSTMKTFGITPELFHQANADRLQHSPDAMLGTSTHDTKRSEDVRNRLNVLSEMPLEWAGLVKRWARMNSRFKHTLPDGRVAPDANEEYLIYQTIVGAWPWRMETQDERNDFVERIQQYMTKALSEAKVNVSWINPDPRYMTAIHAFLKSILLPGKDGREPRFVTTLIDMLPALKLFGGLNSLSQAVLKIISPGIPDFYQGTEMWDLSLVDPDNRRAVDYGLRARALDELLHMYEASGAAAVCRNVLGAFEDGRAKLWTIHRALALRNRIPELFRRGDYTPLVLGGKSADHVLSFSRSHGQDMVVAMVPRFAYTLMNGKCQLPLSRTWADTWIEIPGAAGRSLENIYTGESVMVGADGRVRLASIFAEFPAAVLTLCTA